MKKKSLLWMSMLLLISGMLCACSSDEEDEMSMLDETSMSTAETSDLLGYWKVIANNQTEIKDNNSQSGLCFKNDGEIIVWAMNSESWYEIHSGKWWVSDEGDIMVDVYEGVMCRIYTAIERLSKTHLVIRSWGGFGGTPREEGHDVEYLKLENAPNHDNLNQIHF